MGARGWFLLEAVASGGCAALVVLTLVSRDWIEKLTGVDPDRSSGGVEWLLIAVLVLTMVGLSVRAQRRWREINPRPVG